MMDTSDRGYRVIRGVRIPGLVYGTAWKEDATESLVLGALTSGFRGLDTANQRKHYHEAGVGRAIARAGAAGIRRDELFVQSKFTHRDGQDHRLPYAAGAPANEDEPFAVEQHHADTGPVGQVFVARHSVRTPDNQTGKANGLPKLLTR